ncbi:hypothetical protein WA1_25120 [Scytonema hofmannii PCC 7110]|uniref:AMP-dependent synthetase/ligase domain-containing protein n=2 Tax=Scytonema hofmannii TaxID=34078 RepID=A0A139X8G2_9CYAN|nr:hypothetical protein WA1_25120 [Scytonema hofmannii PCC 7110]
MKFINEIIAKTTQSPDAIMVEVLPGQTTSAQTYSYGEMLTVAAHLSNELHRLQTTQAHPLRVGLVMANSPEWVAADLALMLSGATEVPIPLAFSAMQAKNLLTCIDICLVDTPGADRLATWSEQGEANLDYKAVHMNLRTLLDSSKDVTQYTNVAIAKEQEFICKIIHTSGTTGNPKGVKIRSNGLWDLIASLRRKVKPNTYARYLSIVPLSLLIEQVTAIYMTLSDGGTLVFLPPEIPLLGSAGVTAKELLPYLRYAAPSSMTLPPSMVEAIDGYCKANTYRTKKELFQQLFGRTEPPFLACGGAPTSPTILSHLAANGIVIYEGYGLSENSSVVSWNVPGCIKVGTVGKPLDHVQVKVSDEGELLVKSSSLFAGYTTTDPSSCDLSADGWLKTGDIAAIDNEGFICIYGRKKNVIVTANGRNVSPEWVESKYKTLSYVEEAVIFGNGLEKIYGFFVIDKNFDVSVAKENIAAFGEQNFSEVEQVSEIFITSSTDEVYRNYFTVTGRPIRDKIWNFIN